MFWKKRKKEKVKYDVASENLAVPEVHTGEVEHTETDPQPDEPASGLCLNHSLIGRIISSRIHHHLQSLHQSRHHQNHHQNHQDNLV